MKAIRVQRILFLALALLLTTVVLAFSVARPDGASTDLASSGFAADATPTGMASFTQATFDETPDSATSPPGSSQTAYFDGGIDGGMPVAYRVELAPGQDVNRIVIVDDDVDGFTRNGGMTISGRVVDSSGRGIPGIEVLLMPARPWSMVAPIMYRTDENGYYSVPIIDPGLFKVFFNSSTSNGIGTESYLMSEWYNNGRSFAEAVEVPNGSGGVDAVLKTTGILRGYVNFPSAPFLVALVAYRADRPEVVASTSNAYMVRSDYFSFHGINQLPPGEYKLLVIPESGYYPAHNQPFWYQSGDSWETAETVVVTAGGTTDISINITERYDSGSIFGNFVLYTYGYDSIIPAGTSLSLVDANDETKVIATDWDPYYYEFSGLPAGDYKIKCTLPSGQELWFQPNSDGAFDASDASVIHVDPGTGVNINFSLATETAKVRGNVASATGAPLPYVWIAIYSTDSDPVLTRYALSDVDGSYVSKLAPGTYRACAVDPATGEQYCSEAFSVGWREVVYFINITAPLDIVESSMASTLVVTPSGSMPEASNNPGSGEAQAEATPAAAFVTETAEDAGGTSPPATDTLPVQDEVEGPSSDVPG